jgi:uncharacterized protein YifN (PemK superfamily)
VAAVDAVARALPELDPDEIVFMKNEGFGGAVDMEPSAPGSKVGRSEAMARHKGVLFAKQFQDIQPLWVQCSNVGHRRVGKLRLCARYACGGLLKLLGLVAFCF